MENFAVTAQRQSRLCSGHC